MNSKFYIKNFILLENAIKIITKIVNKNIFQLNHKIKIYKIEHKKIIVLDILIFKSDINQLLSDLVYSDRFFSVPVLLGLRNLDPIVTYKFSV